jgi:NTE family protein
MSKNLALVLGGGAAAGQAWQIGVIAGLAEAGLDLTSSADRVIGTSSGSTTAAWVRSGLPAADLLAAVLAEPARPAGQPRPQQQPPSFDRIRAIGAAAGSAAELRRALGAYGLECDPSFPPEVAQRRRALVAGRLLRPDWPERPMIVVAVDAHTGEVAAFDRDSGVELADAVTASTAFPGLGPTHAIDGRHYINGGVRSGDNADLAAGYATLVVLSPYGGMRQTALPAGQFEGVRRFPDSSLAGEVEALRAQGSRVEVITPDADALAAMGTNQMDPATRAPSARAGYAQGKREAAREGFR